MKVIDIILPLEESKKQKIGSAGQLKGKDKAKTISPVLGKSEKKHPFDGKLVGGT